MDKCVPRRSIMALGAATLLGCAGSRAPLRHLLLTLKRDFETFRAAVRSFAEREGYRIAERREGDFVGDDMIQMEGWRSSILVSRQFLDIRDATIVVGEDGMPTPRDMTPVYSDNVFEAFFYGPTLTLAQPLTNEELDALVDRFTNALVSGDVADVTIPDA